MIVGAGPFGERLMFFGNWKKENGMAFPTIQQEYQLRENFKPPTKRKLRLYYLSIRALHPAPSLSSQYIAPPMAWISLPTIPLAMPEKPLDRKSTRLNSSHVKISYAVFCL